MPPHREKNINKEKEKKRKEKNQVRRRLQICSGCVPQEETWGLGHVDTLTAFIR